MLKHMTFVYDDFRFRIGYDLTIFARKNQLDPFAQSTANKFFAIRQLAWDYSREETEHIRTSEVNKTRQRDPQTALMQERFSMTSVSEPPKWSQIQFDLEFD